MFSLIMYTHILSAVLSIGPFGVLFPLLKRMRNAPSDQLPRDLDTFQFVVRLSKHAGHVLVVSGFLLVWLGGWSWTTPWLIATWIILFGGLFFFARAFSPIIRKLRLEDTDRSLWLNKLHRALWAYILILLLLMWFMVAKPSLWMS
jgi:hypothetical protein